MPDEKAPVPTPAPSRWREASDRLRSNARVFVVSLGAVAATVVVGLSLTGLSSIDSRSSNYLIAIGAALLATLGVVAMLALAMRLASASAVSMADLLRLHDGATNRLGLWWRRLRRPGQNYARKVVGEPSNGYLAGYDNLDAFSKAVTVAHREQQLTALAAAKNPNDKDAFALYKSFRRKSAWYNQRVRALIEVASFQRLRWNFGATSALMALAGAATAVGIVTYAAVLQPSGVPSTPVAVTTHQSILITVPEGDAAQDLFAQVVGCEQAVDALVTGTVGATVIAITVPDDDCRSVTLSAKWDGENFVASFELPAEPAPTGAPAT